MFAGHGVYWQSNNICRHIETAANHILHAQAFHTQFTKTSSFHTNISEKKPKCVICKGSVSCMQILPSLLSFCSAQSRGAKGRPLGSQPLFTGCTALWCQWQDRFYASMKYIPIHLPLKCFYFAKNWRKHLYNIIHIIFLYHIAWHEEAIQNCWVWIHRMHMWFLTEGLVDLRIFNLYNFKCLSV